MIKYIKKQRFSEILLATHGLMLDDFKFTKKLINYGITKFRIPIYGSNSKTHDSITRNIGSFAKTYKGIKNIIKINSKIKIEIRSLIMKQNEEDFLKICDLINNLNINHFCISIPCVANNDYSYVLSYEELKIRLQKIYKYVKKNNYNVAFFHEMPFCLFGIDDTKITNEANKNIPELGNNCQPSKENRSHLKNIPLYRLKEKVDYCQNCKVNYKCEGFNKNILNHFGKPNLRPL